MLTFLCHHKVGTDSTDHGNYLVLSDGSKRWVLLSLNTVSEGLLNIVLLDSERQTAGPEWRKAHLVKGGNSYTYTRVTDVGFAADVKGVILLQEHRHGAHFPFSGHWVRNWIYHRVRRQTYGYLPSWTALLQLLSRYSFPIPLTVGGWVGPSGWLHIPRWHTCSHPSQY